MSVAMGEHTRLLLCPRVLSEYMDVLFLKFVTILETFSYQEYRQNWSSIKKFRKICRFMYPFYS